jgi:hypothetical protein
MCCFSIAPAMQKKHWSNATTSATSINMKKKILSKNVRYQHDLSRIEKKDIQM